MSPAARAVFCTSGDPLGGRQLVEWIRRTKSKTKEELSTRTNQEEKRQVLEEYTGDLRAFLELRRKLS
jgi:hypothetical protein